MKRALRASFRLAALSIFAFSQPLSAKAGSVPELIEELETWLDTNAPWPRREARPAIRIVSPSMAVGQYGSAGYAGGRLRAYYDAETATIALVSPWNPRDPVDQSILLHELAHHRQATHHWYCDAAQELPAYRLQDKWAQEHNVTVEINWTTAVLEAGCTPRDIHPD